MNGKRYELVDKMNHGVSKLSPLSRKLYLTLCDEFLSRHKGETIMTSLSQYANYIGIKTQGITAAINQIECAFNEIHSNTFQRFSYEFVSNTKDDDVSLVISRVDNMEEIKCAMEIIGEAEEPSDDSTYH